MLICPNHCILNDCIELFVGQLTAMAQSRDYHPMEMLGQTHNSTFTKSG